MAAFSNNTTVACGEFVFPNVEVMVENVTNFYSDWLSSRHIPAWVQGGINFRHSYLFDMRSLGLATVYGRSTARGGRLKWKSLPPLNAVYLICGCERDGAGIEHENRCKNGIIYLFGLFGFPFFAPRKNIFPICRLLSCIEWGSYNWIHSRIYIGFHGGRCGVELYSHE